MLQCICDTAQKAPPPTPPYAGHLGCCLFLLFIFIFQSQIYSFLISHFHPPHQHLSPPPTPHPDSHRFLLHRRRACEWIKPPHKHTANVAFRHQRRDRWRQAARVNSLRWPPLLRQAIGVREACWKKGCEPQSMQQLSSFARFINGFACSCQWE